MPAPTPVLLMVRELGIGGAERDLVKLAKTIDRTQFWPHVACFRTDGLRYEEVRDAGLPVLQLPIRSFGSWSLIEGAQAMRRYLREHNIQLVHTFDVPTNLVGVPVAHFCGVPVTIASHLGARELYNKRYHKLLRLVDRWADLHVANSKATQRYLIDQENIPEAQTDLCYNGVETSIFHPAEKTAPEPVAGASLVIGTLCALRPEKRVDLLLRAFARVRHLQAGMKLLIVGSGSALGPLEALRAELGLEAECVFVPAQTDVVPWIHALDIYVMSSESESFPNALLESMACGCAVVGSRVGGIPELIDDGKNGLLFDSMNVEQLAGALAKLITDAELRRRFAREAAVCARDRFSMEINTQRWEAIYRRMLTRENSA